VLENFSRFKKVLPFCDFRLKGNTFFVYIQIYAYLLTAKMRQNIRNEKYTSDNCMFETDCENEINFGRVKTQKFVLPFYVF